MHRIGFFVLLSFSAAGASAQDLNGNLTPDSTERRNGAADCNHNGFLDPLDATRPHFATGVEHLNGTWPFLNNTNDAQPIDFDNDGDMDLAALSSGSNGQGFVALWRNDGGAGFAWVRDITDASWSYLWSVRVGDLNGDGRADLAVGDGGYARVYVLLATGDGTFAPPVTLAGSPSNNGMMRIALGDLDNDGDLDLAAPNAGIAKVDVWRNNGSGVFGSRASFTTGDTPNSVAIADFTGDGLADIAVANRFILSAPATADGTVSLLRNTGTGFVTHATLTMPQNSGPFGVMRPRPWDLALCDTDHDGDQDLIVSSDDSQRLDLFLNNGAGAFTLRGAIGTGYYLGSSAARFVVADFDADGWEDVAWGDTEANAATIYLNQRDGSFRFFASYAVGNYAGKSLGAADFDGDGLVDLVSSNDVARTFHVALGTGGGAFDAPPRIRPAEYPSNAMLADFNNDGLTDFGFALQSQTAYLGIGVYLGTGGGRYAPTPVMTSTASAGVFTPRDINHDGIMDLFEGVGRCNVYLGHGNGSFRPAIVNAPNVLLRHVVADINLDGHHDVVWISPGHPGQLYRALGDGAGHFGPATLVGVVPAEDESIGSGDITGDGAPEVFTGHRQGLSQPGGILSIYPNNTDGSFGERQDRFIVLSPLSPAVGAIACGDFDDDGDNDVAVSASGIRVYWNQGDGTLPATPALVSATGASDLWVADIDRDGVSDLYGRAGSGIAYLSRGDATFLPPMILPFIDSNGRNSVVGDVNNDGRPDLLVEPENSWDKIVWLNLPPWSEDANANGVPDDCEGPICNPDFNGDGVADQGDVACLIATVAGDGSCTGLDPDFNRDGVADQDDTAALIDVIAGGSCP